MIAVFAFGTATHASDYIRYGFPPYEHGPPAINFFWNVLVAIDASVVVLLLRGWRRAGVSLAVATMIVDVSVNTYTWRWLGTTAGETAVPIQAAFLGFVLGAAPLLWPSAPRSASARLVRLGGTEPDATTPPRRRFD